MSFHWFYFHYYLFCFVINLLQYIRIAAETDTDNVEKLLFVHWGLDFKLVIISIFGNDQISRSDPKLAAAVSEGLTLVRTAPVMLLYHNKTKTDNRHIKCEK